MYNLNEEIGKRIVALRKEHHMTQEKLAEELDISIKHCSAVERGYASLSLERFMDLCDLFDVSLDYIIRGESPDGINKVPPSVIEIFCKADAQEAVLLREYWNLYQKIRKLED